MRQQKRHLRMAGRDIPMSEVWVVFPLCMHGVSISQSVSGFSLGNIMAIKKCYFFVATH